MLICDGHHSNPPAKGERYCIVCERDRYKAALEEILKEVPSDPLPSAWGRIVPIALKALNPDKASGEDHKTVDGKPWLR